MMRTRVMVVVLVAVTLLAGCGSTSSDATKGTTTTTVATVPATTTSTTVEATTTTEADTVPDSTDPDSTEPDTTNPANLGPVGDEKLVPLLLEPDDFGSGLVYDDSSDDTPEKEFCDGVSFTVDWQATANMSAKPTDGKEFLGVAESIIAFDTGQATAFLAEFDSLTEQCSAKGDGTGVDLVPLEGFGDGGFRNAPPTGKAGESPAEVAIVRVGDDVIVLIGLFSDTLLTDAVIQKAVDKVKSG